MRWKLLLYLFIVLPVWSLSGQSSLFNTGSEETAAEETPESDKTKPLPAGYRNILLGMPLEQVKTALTRESRFDYRGDPDVSIRDMGSRDLITSRGRGFIEEGFFQFHENQLYLIVINFNREKIDYFTLQQQLTESYGDPDDISPEGMKWQNDSVILSLEYPLILKYLDRPVFEGFLEDAAARKGFEEVSRNEFLKDF